MRRIPIVILLAPLALAGGDPPRAPRDADALRAFYADNCVRCHGADGSALGPDGARLKGADFTDAKAMEREKDASLAKTILKGTFFGLGMPSFKEQLTEEEAQRMVKEVVRKAEKGKPIGSKPAAK